MNSIAAWKFARVDDHLARRRCRRENVPVGTVPFFPFFPRFSRSRFSRVLSRSEIRIVFLDGQRLSITSDMADLRRVLATITARRLA